MNISVSFLTPVQNQIVQIEELMRSQAEHSLPDLQAALDVLLSAGGKRIRPALTVLVGHMLNASEDTLLNLAAAIELLHTATLVHDDLIDGALLRRGNPTLNSQWSPGATVLTGDFLFACAARLAAETNLIPVMQLFSETLKTIVNGEITQQFSSKCRLNRTDYDQRIYAKTASLFETSAKAAGMIARADPVVIESLRIYGHDVGMAFQIVDDILDFTSSEAMLGKPVGSDLHMGLITLPALYYAENHPTDGNIQQLQSGNCLNSDLQIDSLVNSIRSSDAIQLSFNVAEKYIQNALRALKDMPQGIEHQSLEELALYIVERRI